MVEVSVLVCTCLNLMKDKISIAILFVDLCRSMPFLYTNSEYFRIGVEKLFEAKAKEAEKEDRQRGSCSSKQLATNVKTVQNIRLWRI